MANKSTRTLIGIGWLDLGFNQTLYKFFRTPTIVEGYTGPPELPPAYAIENVKPEAFPVAFQWIITSFWKDHGVWYTGRPGIVFSPDLTEVFRAVKALSEERIGELLRHPVMIPAPVAFDWTEYHHGRNKGGTARYAFVSPKRTRRSMRKLRDRYPDAGELAFQPLDIVQGYRDENGNPLKAACHDWTTGPAF